MPKTSATPSIKIFNYDETLQEQPDDLKTTSAKPITPEKISPSASAAIPTSHAVFKRLKCANHFVQRTLVLGSSNRIEDLDKTGGFSLYANRAFQKSWYEQNLPAMDSASSRWVKKYAPTRSSIAIRPRYPNALYYLKQYSLLYKSESVFTALVYAFAAEIKRVGNCSDRAYLALKYLWQHSVDMTRLEVISMQNFDHSLLIINRREGSHLLAPESWGDACYCLDAWYKDGIIFKGTDFYKHMRVIYEYVRYQDMKISGASEMKPAVTIGPYLFEVLIDISPQKTPYPSNGPYHTINTDHKIVFGCRDADEYLEKVKKHQTKHKKAFAISLEAIKSGKHSLFKPKPKFEVVTTQLSPTIKTTCL